MPQVNQSRRDFLKSSAGIVAASTLAGSMLSSSVYAAGDETIKIALIGCGGRGSGATGQALSTSGPVKLVAVADAFEDNARTSLANLQRAHPDLVDVKEDHIFSGFDAYQKALAADIDMVILATPPGFRPIHFEAAVAAGKNIFMEKPVSTDAAGIRRVLAAAAEAKKKNLKVGVGLQRHHQAKYIETVKRIQDGQMGKLELMRVYWNGDRPWVRPRKPGQTEMEYQMRNWYYFLWLCGDHINEQHIHNLDVANWVKGGPPATAQGQGGRQAHPKESGEIFDHHFVEFTYPDGMTCLSQCRHMSNCWNSVSEHAHGPGTVADIGGGKITGPGDATWRYAGANGRAKGGDPDPYQVEHDDLFDAIRNNKDYNEAERGAYSTMTALMGRMATYSGKQIKWEDALNSTVSVMPTKFAFDADPPTLPDAEGHYALPIPGIYKAV
jgi:myo-inositol 2-dehydrogenase/D-chiro-inositol 1-dehydrogenase